MARVRFLLVSRAKALDELVMCLDREAGPLGLDREAGSLAGLREFAVRVTAAGVKPLLANMLAKACKPEMSAATRRRVNA